MLLAMIRQGLPPPSQHQHHTLSLLLACFTCRRGLGGGCLSAPFPLHLSVHRRAKQHHIRCEQRQQLARSHRSGEQRRPKSWQCQHGSGKPGDAEQDAVWSVTLSAVPAFLLPPDRLACLVQVGMNMP